MKTAVATSPSRCRNCTKSATRLLVWEHQGRLYEDEFCDEHFHDMRFSLGLNTKWLEEKL